MNRYSKAISAVVAAVAASLAVFNIDLSPEVQAAIITIAVAVATVLAPKNSV